MKKLCLLCLTIFCFMISVKTQDLSAYQKKTFTRNKETLNYRILYPENFDPKKKYPLIIFLHGAGERGRDNEKQLKYGATFFLKDSIRKIFPAIIVFPQCPEYISWSYVSFYYDSVKQQPDIIFSFQKKPTTPAFLVKQLADSLMNSGQADPGAMFMGGLSLGGFGTFDFIERYPGYFAAAFPICGGGDTSYLHKVIRDLSTSLWIFHGASDPTVNVKYSRQFYKAYQGLKWTGAEIKYTEYPGVKHNSWDNAFAEPGLIEWLKSKAYISVKVY